MVHELEAETNRLDRLFTRFTDQSKAVSISSVALIVSLLALLMAWMAVDDAKTAALRSEMQAQTIAGLEDDIDVYRIRAAKMNAWLSANGVPTHQVYGDTNEP